MPTVKFESFLSGFLYQQAHATMGAKNSLFFRERIAKDGLFVGHRGYP
jgi:hypothetical protein